MQSLDVKFVVHHGEFIKQKMAGREELAGRDVILVHRLLKNEVNKKLGGARLCALFRRLRAGDGDRSGGARPRRASRDDRRHRRDKVLGARPRAGLDEGKRNNADHGRSATTRSRVIESDFAAPPPAVWEFVTSPAHHSRWQRSDGVVETAVKGRRGAGTQNHCMHGKDAIIEDILDWRPFDYVTLTALLPIPGAPKILMTYAFEGRHGRRHAFRAPLRQAEAEGPAVLRTGLADRAGQLQCRAWIFCAQMLEEQARAASDVERTVPSRCRPNASSPSRFTPDRRVSA